MSVLDGWGRLYGHLGSPSRTFQRRAKLAGQQAGQRGHILAARGP